MAEAGGWKDPFQYHSRERLSWGCRGKGVLSVVFVEAPVTRVAVRM